MSQPRTARKYPMKIATSFWSVARRYLLPTAIRSPIQFPRNHPPAARTSAVRMLKLIRRRQMGGLSAAAVLTGSSPPSLAGSPQRIGEVDAIERRQHLRRGRLRLLLLRHPGLEIGTRDDVPLLRHVTVPEAAELCAPDLEIADSTRADVGDVVDARHGVRLDSQLVGPERMGHVERRHVEGDEHVVGGDGVGRLEAAVGWIAEGPVPLLAYYLDRERVLVP